MTNPLVSILMPTFNRAPILPHAIESALAQTYRNIEVIVYDDGSSDITPSIIKGIHDNRLRYIRCADNHGVAYARNRLLSEARGELACWQDSDDRSSYLRVEWMVDAMRDYNPGYVRTGHVEVGHMDDGGWKRPPSFTWKGGVAVATVMFRPSQAPKYHEEVTHGGEDMVWECDLVLNAGRAVYIPMGLYQVGRKSPHRISMAYKDPEQREDVERCKRLVRKYQDASVKKIQTAGIVKLPRTVTWDWLSKRLGPIYRKQYGGE